MRPNRKYFVRLIHLYLWLRKGDEGIEEGCVFPWSVKLFMEGGKLVKAGSVFASNSNSFMSSRLSRPLRPFSWFWNLVQTWCFTRPNRGRHCLIMVMLCGWTIHSEPCLIVQTFVLKSPRILIFGQLISSLSANQKNQKKHYLLLLVWIVYTYQSQKWKKILSVWAVNLKNVGRIMIEKVQAKSISF